jgi:hypothetical protein
MERKAAGALVRTGGAGDHHNRRPLGIGAGNGIDQIEGARPVGDHRHAQSGVVARRGVGREADTPARGSTCSAGGSPLSSITL